METAASRVLSPRVSPQERAFYRDNGFIVLQSPSESLTRDLIQWTDEIKNLPHKANAWMHYEEVNANGDRALSATEYFADHHPGFKDFLHGAPMRDFLHQLLGEEMTLFKEKINYKGAKSGGFKAHIDASAYGRVANMGRVVAVTIAVDPQTTENGCLEVVPGSHSMNIPIGADQSLDDAWINAQTWTPLHLQRGQFVVFDSHLAHRSAENKTNKGRAAIFATYNTRSDDEDKRAAYYTDRRKLWPATADRDPAKDYALGASIFGAATPMLTIDPTKYENMGL